MNWLKRLALIPLALLSLAASNPVLVPDVSQRKIDIVYSFTGAELLLFGAILYPADASLPRMPISSWCYVGHHNR